MVQRRHRHVHAHETLLRHGREDVEIARDERRLRRDADGDVELRQHLEDLARDRVVAVDRLVGVGRRTQRHDARIEIPCDPAPCAGRRRR